MVCVEELGTARCDLVNLPYASFVKFLFASNVATCFQLVKQRVERAMSEFDLIKALGFSEDFVSPYGFVLDEFQNKHV